MACNIRCTVLLLAFLLSVISVFHSTANGLDHEVIETSEDPNKSINTYKELEKDANLMRGRKTAAGEKKESTNGSEPVSMEKKDEGVKIDFSIKGGLNGKASDLKPVDVHEKDKKGDLMKMFNMLNRDYAQRARRRGPIHNR